MKSFSRELGRDASRDVGAARSPPQPRSRSAKRWVVVIGIDRYQDWRPLGNAVGDARGALAAFTKLGFEPFGNSLLDEAATCSALHHLVNDQLRHIGSDDSLVLFFAGHGHTETTEYPDRTCTRTGYLIPVDADPRGGRVGSWLHLENWLKLVAHLQARHILVILDACHSGVALAPLIETPHGGTASAPRPDPVHSGVALAPLVRWRGEAPAINEPLERLRTRRSRRVITSAQDDQLALDGGPVHGHSLFTGCLIEALGSIGSNGDSFVTGTELAVHVQRRVMTYPQSQQTPDVGAFELDDRGELVLEGTRRGGRVPTGVSGADGHRRHPRRAGDTTDLIGGAEPESRSDPRRSRRGAQGADVRPAPEPVTPVRWSIPALQRQHEQRDRGEPVLTLAAGSSQTVLSGWSTWAAQRGHLTLLTDGDTSEAVIRDLLGQMPWSRCVPAARARLAAAADLAPEGIPAELLARSAGQERTRWLQDVAAGDPIAMISGWLLSVMCSPGAPDPASAPLAGFELLLALCQLAQPISILLHHPAPTAPWLVGAIATAAAIVGRVPGLPVAVTGPVQLVDEVLANHRSSAAMSMARQGLVRLEAAPPTSPERDGLARQRLHVALARDARTTGQFERNVKVPIHDLPRWLEVNLVARSACLTIEIDDWYQRGDLQAYHRDRIEDVRLQRAGFFPMRFLIDDIEQQLDRVVDAIAAELANRTALRSLSEDMP